jgi:hypothetical protein
MRFRLRTDREGVALAIVAVMMVGLLAIVSLAIDLGMAYTAHAEAQRVADASALAGAAAFLDYSDPYLAVGDADAHAREYAGRNVVRNQLVDPVADVVVEVYPADELVRVSVRRTGLGTWFARFLGVDELTVSAVAAAKADNAGVATCLKPWAVMDLWKEGPPGIDGSCGQDTDCDGWWDEGEEWVYEPPEAGGEDYYDRADHVGDPAPATGYGSAARNGTTGDGVTNDWGRLMTLKSPDPKDEYVPNPGVFLPWRLPLEDGTMSSGAMDYRDNIANCNPTPVALSDPDAPSDEWHEYPLELGNMVGPTFHGVQDLIAQDPDAYWDETTHSVRGSDWGETLEGGSRPWLNSPRVIKIGLIEPDEIVGSGMDEIKFNNFALLFIEDQESMHAPVQARFLYYVAGDGHGGTGATTGPLVKWFRLVE